MPKPCLLARVLSPGLLAQVPWAMLSKVTSIDHVRISPRVVPATLHNLHCPSTVGVPALLVFQAVAAAAANIGLRCGPHCCCNCCCCRETWIVMDLMDRGNLATAVRHGKLFLDQESNRISMVRGIGEEISSDTAIQCFTVQHIRNTLSRGCTVWYSLTRSCRV